MFSPSWTPSAGPPFYGRWPMPGQASSPQSRPGPSLPSSSQIRQSGAAQKAGAKPVDKLGNILPRVLRREPGGAKFLGVQVATAFRMVIGADPAGLCDEIELHSGTLVVTTSSPALARQLRLDSELILARLNGLNLGRKARPTRVRTAHPPPTRCPPPGAASSPRRRRPAAGPAV